MNLKLEYDDLYSRWVVWKVDRNIMYEVYKGLKSHCKNYIKKQGKRRK